MVMTRKDTTGLTDLERLRLEMLEHGLEDRPERDTGHLVPQYHRIIKGHDDGRHEAGGN